MDDTEVTPKQEKRRGRPPKSGAAMSEAERSRQARERRAKIAKVQADAFTEIREIAERGLAPDESDDAALGIAREALLEIESRVIQAVEARDLVSEGGSD